MNPMLELLIKERAATVRRIWGFLIFGMIALSIFMGEVGGLLLPIFLVMIIGGIISTAVVWNSGTDLVERHLNDEYHAEKAKRDRLDSVLRTLSNDELYRLRERLSTGEIDDDQLAYMIGDDGELIQRG